MLLVISPAKSLDFKTEPIISKYSQPEFLSEAEEIVQKLKSLSFQNLNKLLGISPKLGNQNLSYLTNWHIPFTPENAKQAILAYSGNVFQGLDANSLSEEQFDFVQNHLLILSGLYGVLKPLDLIQPYRLEMQTKLSVSGKKDLYIFWQKQIAEKIENSLKKNGTKYLINLASNEYFKSIDFTKLNVSVITPEFKELKDGKYKIISVFAKKARGLMLRFIIENKITNPEELIAFKSSGYSFNPGLSKENKYVFTRDY